MKRSRTFLALAVGAGFLFAACSGSPASQAPAETTDVRLQLQWAPQAQFAGYFAAAAEGYYEDEGLNVTFVPAVPTSSRRWRARPTDGPEFTISWVPKVLEARRRHAAVRPREHRPGLPALRHEVGVVEGLEHHESGRLRRQEGRRLGLRQRVRGHRGRPQGRTRGRHRLREGHPDVRHGAAAVARHRRRRGDDLQRVRAGARGDQPRHRRAVPARGPQRHRLQRRRHGHAPGRALRTEGVARPGGQRRTSRRASSRRRSAAGSSAATTRTSASSTPSTRVRRSAPVTRRG